MILAMALSSSCPSKAAMKLISANCSMLGWREIINVSSLSENHQHTEKSGNLKEMVNAHAHIQMHMRTFESAKI